MVGLDNEQRLAQEKAFIASEYDQRLQAFKTALTNRDEAALVEALQDLEDLNGLYRTVLEPAAAENLELIMDNQEAITESLQDIKKAGQDIDPQRLLLVKEKIIEIGLLDLFKECIEGAALEMVVLAPEKRNLLELSEKNVPSVELASEKFADTVTAAEFSTKRQEWITARRFIVSKKQALTIPAEQALKSALILELDRLMEEVIIFEEDNAIFFARNPSEHHLLRMMVENLERTKVDVQSLTVKSSQEKTQTAENEKKIHKSFTDLQTAIVYLNDRLSDLDFDPNDTLPDDGSFSFLNSQEKILSALQIAQSRHQRAKTFQSVYAPGRATTVDDLDFYETLEQDYISPAESTIILLEGRINVINDKRFEEWKQQFYDNLVTQNPNVAAVLQEVSRTLPVKPYGADTPQARLSIIVDPSVPKDTLQLAYDELNAIDVHDFYISKQQKTFIDSVRKAIDSYVEKLELMIINDDEQKKAVKWEKETQKISKLIEDALKVVDPPANKTKEHEALALEGQLVANYNLLLQDGYLDESNYADEKIKAKILELVGKDKTSGKYHKALAYLEKVLKPIKEKLDDPTNMSWEQLVEIIEKNNIDVYDHVGMANPAALPKNVSVYNAFHARKNKVEGSSQQDEQRRIDFVSWIVLSKIESINMNEGQIPTCTRPDLFPMLGGRQMSREIILKSSTYHPEYGVEFSRILDEVIVQVATPGSEIFYDILTSSGNGRVILKNYLKRVYKPQLMSSIYKGLPREAQEKKVDQVIEYINVIYNLFDLLTVSFAELQKQTKTSGHQRSKGGKKLEGTKNWVLICRPDCGLVHDTQRYDSPSNWSAHWLTYMRDIPDEFGRRGDSPEGITYHEKLLEQQQDLILYQNAHFDASKFTGKNGIPSTTMFNPIFPDTRTFLHLAKNSMGRPEMVEFGDDVWGIDTDGKYKKLGKKGQKVKYGSKEIRLEQNLAITEWYEDVAMAGWEKILKLTFGELPAKVTDHMIIEKSNMGGEDPSLGLMDIFLNIGCGTAKMYPGNHMENIAPLLTHYIMRIFARYETSTKYREHTFRKVVSKIQNAAAEKGGLGGYASVAAQVIRNISRGVDGWSDEKILKTNSHHFKIGDVLVDGIFNRKKQRIEWMLRYYKLEDHTAPRVTIPGIGGFLTSIRALIDRLSADDQIHFWKCVNGEEPLPDPGVNRTGSLFKTVDDKH